MARRPCLTCGKPCNGSYCDEHQPLYGHHDAQWRGAGGTRQLVLERDQHRCKIVADDGCTHVATTVHRLPEYGTWHDGNLDAYVSACAHCHGVVDGARATRRSTIDRA